MKTRRGVALFHQHLEVFNELEGAISFLDAMVKTQVEDSRPGGSVTDADSKIPYLR